MADRITRRRRALRLTLRTIARHRTAILGYHGIGDPIESDPHNLFVSQAAFRAQLEAMLDAGFEFTTVAALGGEVHAGAIAPGRVALCFDDGMEDNHHVVLPILREYGLTATMYIVSGLVGQPNPFLHGVTRMMTADELREVAAHGIDVGAHSVSHPDLSMLGYEECLREMVDSREQLEVIVGRPARTFAYPFGRYGVEAAAAARDAGFELAVAGGRGRLTPYELRRSLISPRDNWSRFVMKLADVFEPAAALRRAF